MGIDQPSALNNAYSNAVQQALGLYVDAETMVQNDQIVRDQILTYSKGFIQETAIVSQNQANGLFQVNIRAKVKRQKLLEQAKASNISVKQVEGASLHAQVVTQVKQEQDAKALLDKALSPFMGSDLYRATLAGDPEIVNEEQGIVKLSYPVHLYVDNDKYKGAVDYLVSILDQIAIGKQDYMKKDTRSITIDDVRKVADQLKFGESTGSGRKRMVAISVMNWHDPMFSNLKWLLYSLTGDARREKETIKSKFTVSLELFGNNENDLISQGTMNLSFSNHGGHKIESDGSPFRIENDNGSSISIYSFKPYFEGSGNNDMPGEVLPRQRRNAFIKLPININVSVYQKDLARIKLAKLQVQPAVGQ